MTSPPPSAGQLVRYAALMGAIVGGLAGIGIVALMSIDYFHYRGIPSEQARVVSQEISPTQRVACGPKAIFNDTDAQVTTFVVADPRPDLPETFTWAGCGIDEKPGDVVTVVRRSADPDDIYLAPLTVSDLAIFSAAFAGLGFALTFTWWMLLGTLKPNWDRWVEAGRTGPDPA